ncbi:MAG: hypothetical protein HQ500_04760 [Flavobacteriales bacterium]|nr:hypothetical protein [Flavobacteriales bacterium]
MKLRPFIALLFFGLLASVSFGQSSFDNPSEVITSFYRAMEQDDLATRSTELKALFLEDGTIHSIVQKSSLTSSPKGGSVTDFLQGSGSFYRANTMSYDEIERSIDYYVDIATVHSLVFQTIVERGNTSVAYEQMLWFSFTMVFENDRWFLTNVSWVNAFEDEDIDDAMRLDTLWHPTKD